MSLAWQHKGLIGVATLLSIVLGMTGAWAESQFQILGEPILTLRDPSGGSDQRLAELEERFQAILAASATAPMQVQAVGDQTQAQIMINGQLLLEVTPEDAEANATTQVIALADQWATRLQMVLSQAPIQQELIRGAGLPPQLSFQGRAYSRQSEPVADLGRFTTDGSRVQGWVVYWEQPEGSIGLPKAPPTPLTTIYLINGNREFVPYEAL